MTDSADIDDSWLTVPSGRFARHCIEFSSLLPFV